MFHGYSWIAGRAKNKHDLTITAFFNKAKGLADTLASIGQPLRDDEFTSYILNGLDKEYDSCFKGLIIVMIL
jgi:hypothetical protein